MDRAKRIEHLRAIMQEKQLDAAIIFNFENQFYFSGLRAITYSRPIIMVVETDQHSLIIPKLEEKHAREKTDADHIHVYHEVAGNDGGSTDYHELFDEVLSGFETGSRVGVESGSLPLDFGRSMEKRGLECVDIQKDVARMRAIKSDAEIELIRKSGELVSGALKHTIENSSAGKSELEIDYHGNQYLFDMVSERYSDSTLDFFVMSPSGVERTNMPHIFSNTRKLEKGDVIIHSRQVGLNGYRAECERTYFVGQPTEAQEKAFKVMLEAHLAALDFIKPGVTAQEVNEAALAVIRSEGYESSVSHRTGHGIGIGQHEEPSLRFDNDLVLEPGMVFCVEPGIYIPDIGGFRHSDTVVLTEDGADIITDYPRDLESLIVGE
ncbi:aminopeptidase P family protein [Salinicoccus cyprini]|uniref:Aminopeptidase P family protein n=1 Tax=Salinicoccus cyprini TaxID=2493691 RepID=A0A558AXG0_9STAP|nr:Xaa-Pro peptidase family protein [Salinicoccus cyprini]TVT28945.1 aminopeptidase P family protein [Salinicoccus cyprini]